MNKTSIARRLRSTACLLAVCALSVAAEAQYYYKDIVTTAQINMNYLLLKGNRVTSIVLTPSAIDPQQNTVTLKQTVYPSQRLIITYTKVPDATESWLKSYYNAKGLLVKTVDSSVDAVASSFYEYNAGDQITSITSNSVPVNDPAEKEVHQWTYNSNGQPAKMIKVKNDNDTTIVTFTADEKGNPGEEKAVHKKNTLGTIYYYYDASNRLTDVAKYNVKAARILPDYMFEYTDNGRQISQMILVPEGSADYQTWRYVYNAAGLKEKDICYNKQKQLVASIDYVYSFGK